MFTELYAGLLEHPPDVRVAPAAGQENVAAAERGKANLLAAFFNLASPATAANKRNARSDGSIFFIFVLRYFDLTHLRAASKIPL